MNPRPQGDIAVVIPAHNRAANLGRALESVRKQTLQPLEVVVVDDASEDGTAEVARAAGIRVIRNDRNCGSGISRNRGIGATSAPWIAFLDSDDEWYPEHLARVRSAADDHVMVTAAAVDNLGGVRGNVTGRLLALSAERCFVPDNPVVTSTVLASRQVMEAAGLFRSLPRAQDLDLWVRVLEIGSGIALPIATATYNARSEWPTEDVRAREAQALADVLASYADRPWMSPRICSGVAGRQRWDQLRLAQHEGRITEACRHLGWLISHPAAWPALGGTLQLRRQARRRRSELRSGQMGLDWLPARSSG